MVQAGKTPRPNPSLRGTNEPRNGLTPRAGGRRAGVPQIVFGVLAAERRQESP